jgi:hypothetical protein
VWNINPIIQKVSPFPGHFQINKLSYKYASPIGLSHNYLCELRKKYIDNVRKSLCFLVFLSFCGKKISATKAQNHKVSQRSIF